MPLYVVRDNDRWGYSLNLVRAPSEADAIAFVRPHGCNVNRVTCEELQPDGDGILWCEDESPDTGDRD